MNFTVIIPARYASTRLPGKPLLDIAGKPMIRHVHERALASGASRVTVATDDARIQQAALAFGADVCMTSDHHNSGTERITEVIDILKEPDERVVVNVQGDEPLLPPGLIRLVAEGLFTHPLAQVATLCESITDEKDMFDPAVVKVITDKNGFALYFSRAPIPWNRDRFGRDVGEQTMPKGARHIGIYAYRAAFLRQYVKCPRCSLEEIESLEQLRVLYEGGRIYVDMVNEDPGFGVDTPEDLARVREIVKAHMMSEERVGDSRQD